MDGTIDLSDALVQLDELQDSVANIHPLLKDNYFLGVARGSSVTIYLRKNGKYSAIRNIDVPIDVPAGTRAAFPVAEVGETVAIVTPDAFESIEELVIVLHEFVHCYQHRNGEPDFRQRLALFVGDHADPMWELTYPISYQSEEFRSFVSDIRRLSGQAIVARVKTMLADMGTDDAQYVVWQIWKEGLARYIENLIRENLGLAVNSSGSDPSCTSRTSLYYVGCELWDAFVHSRASEPIDFREAFEFAVSLRTA